MAGEPDAAVVVMPSKKQLSNWFPLASDSLPGVRKELFLQEENFFKSNPNVSGMAASDGRVILNPYSNLSETERAAVVQNEQARLLIKQKKVKAPEFALTQEQIENLRGTPYENDKENARATIAARILSGDPSAGKPTDEQIKYVKESLMPLFGDAEDHEDTALSARIRDYERMRGPWPAVQD